MNTEELKEWDVKKQYSWNDINEVLNKLRFTSGEIGEFSSVLDNVVKEGEK
jgi:hypothetical protein